MKHPYVYFTIASVVLLLGTGPLGAEPTGSTTMAGGNQPSPDKVPQDQRTDLTGGEAGIPDEYSTTPVRQGHLKEVTDSKWLNQAVTNQQGEQLGTITKVLKDEKTQDIEYVMFKVADSEHTRPMKWSLFKEQGDKLTLNMSKRELLPNVARTGADDQSPDISMFKEEIEQKRSESKPQIGPGDGRGTTRPAPSAGPMGEEKAAGNLGTRGAPPGQAPGFENEAAKKQQ